MSIRWIGAVEKFIWIEVLGEFSQSDLTTIPLNTVEQMAGFVVKRYERRKSKLCQVVVPLTELIPITVRSSSTRFRLRTKKNRFLPHQRRGLHDRAEVSPKRTTKASRED